VVCHRHERRILAPLGLAHAEAPVFAATQVPSMQHALMSSSPTRAGLQYTGCWGFLTALLRPLAGEGGWELLERSYNFGVPWLMLWMHGVG
jgi:hypothetical protein